MFPNSQKFQKSLKNFKSQSYKLNSKVHYKSKEHPHGNKGTIRYIFKESFRLKDGTVIPVVDVISIKSQSKLSQVFQIAGAQWVLVGGLAVLAGKSITGTLDNNALYIGSGILLVGSIPFVFRKNNHKIGSKWKLQIR